MKAQFIVETPFQLISAIEVIGRKKIKIYKIILLMNANGENSEQIRNIIELFSINKNNVELVCSSTTLIRWIKLFVLKIKLFKCKGTLYIGDFRSIAMQVCSKIHRYEVCLIDDGSITYNIYEKYISKNIGYRYPTLKKRLINKLFQMMLLGYRKPSEFKIITCFNINGLERHQFQSIKLRLSGSGIKRKKMVVVFGSNYSVLNMDEIRQEKLLRYAYEDLRIKFPGEQIVYYPHRKNKNILIPKKLGFDIKQQAYAAEIELLLNNIDPICIVGFVSGVLQTLPIILGNSCPVISYFPRLDGLGEDAKEEFDDLQSIYSDDPRVEVITVEC